MRMVPSRPAETRRRGTATGKIQKAKLRAEFAELYRS
jgi:hypothetical protein